MYVNKLLTTIQKTNIIGIKGVIIFHPGGKLAFPENKGDSILLFSFKYR